MACSSDSKVFQLELCQKLSSLERHDHDFSWDIRSRLVHEKISIISDSIA